MIESLESWLWSYPALGFACTISGLGVPIPEDVLVLYAGLSIALGRFELVPTTIIVLIGFLIRDSIAWALGHWLGDRLLKAKWFQRLVPPERIERAQALVRERGPVAVLGGRLMVGMRAPVFIVAGASGLPYPKFLLWDALGMAVTAPTLLAAGYYVGPPVLQWASSALPWIRNLIAIVIVIAGVGIWRRRSSSDPR